MTAYVIAGLNPKNAEKLQAYSAAAAPIIAQYEGEFLAKGEQTLLSGEYGYKVQVIIMFPSRALAEAWYFSPEYQALIPIRDEGMACHFQLVGE